MPVEPVPATRPLRLRADLPEVAAYDSASTSVEVGGDSRWFDRVGRPSVVALAAFFVLLGAANLDLSATEARLGLAVGDALGPLGRVVGYWDPSVWPLPVALGKAWGFFEEEGPTQNAIRWPAAIAACLIGYLLTRRARLDLTPRAGLMVALAWFGSLALLDRSFGVGGDLIAGLGTVAALDRLLAKGSGWSVGFWASWAFLAGGWPPVAVLALCTVVLGRSGATWTWKMSIPIVATVAAWSAWALVQAPAAAWASALGLPITQRSAWLLALAVVAAGSPWAPFAGLLASRSVRESWAGPGRSLVMGWLQVVGACLVVGSIVPGLGTASTVPALAGLAFVSASVWDRAWTVGSTSPSARRALLGLTLVIAGFWLVVVLVWGGYVAFSVAFYRGTMIATLALSVAGFVCATEAIRWSDARRGFAAMALVAVALKLAHWGYYVPEMNYRTSAGPWGRAIGQWVPDKHPIYTLHAWPADLAYAMARPVRQLAGPQLIEFQPGQGSKFVLLADSEYAEYQNWSEGWPKLIKVAEFSDELGLSRRILTRTEGPIVLGHPYKGGSATE